MIGLLLLLTPKSVSQENEFQGFSSTCLQSTSIPISEVYYFYFTEEAKRLDINVDFADCLITKESQWNPEAKNPISSAGGLFQFIDSTWISTVDRMNKNWSLEDKYDAYKNIEAGLWLLKHDGPSHWIVWPKCIHLLQ